MTIKRGAQGTPSLLPVALLLAVLLLALATPAAHAQFVGSSTSLWNAILYGGNGVADPALDQQTGQRESDLVGTSAVPSAYMAFDPGSVGSHTDGTMYFRVRVAEDSQGAGYSGYLWVGIDADQNGTVDIFTGVNVQGSSAENVIRNPGTGTNSSPSTTSISNTNLSPAPYAHTSSNYNWAAVGAANYTGSNFDIDGGGQTDYFMSFGIPFQDLVNNLNTTGSGRPSAIAITDQTRLGFVIATSQQGNSINQDYNGGNIGVNSASSFSSLGIVSSYNNNLSQVTIPEPSTYALLGAGLLALALGIRVGSLSSLDYSIVRSDAHMVGSSFAMLAGSFAVLVSDMTLLLIGATTDDI